MNLKAIRYESTSLNRIVADKLHHVINCSLSCLQQFLFTLIGIIDDVINFLRYLVILGRFKVSSHDPIFGANYYSDRKELVMRIKISMS